MFSRHAAGQVWSRFIAGLSPSRRVGFDAYQEANALPSLPWGWVWRDGLPARRRHHEAMVGDIWFEDHGQLIMYQIVPSECDCYGCLWERIHRASKSTKCHNCLSGHPPKPYTVFSRWPDPMGVWRTKMFGSTAATRGLALMSAGDLPNFDGWASRLQPTTTDSQCQT